MKTIIQKFFGLSKDRISGALMGLDNIPYEEVLQAHCGLL